jgi:hypothetical protein
MRSVVLTLYALMLSFCTGDCIRVETPFVFSSPEVCTVVGLIEVGRLQIKVPPDQRIDYEIQCVRHDPRPELA